MLAPELIMHSPITRKPLRGRELAIDVFASLFDAIGEFQIIEEVAAGETTMFCWRARYRDKEIEGVDVVRLNALGQVKEIRVLIRPLIGIAVFGQALGPPLAATRTAVPRSIVRMLNGPLTLLFKLIDAIASRLLGL